MDLLEAIIIVIIFILLALIFYFGWYIKQEPEVYRTVLHMAIFGLQSMFATRSHYPIIVYDAGSPSPVQGRRPIPSLSVVQIHPPLLR